MHRESEREKMNFPKKEEKDAARESFSKVLSNFPTPRGCLAILAYVTEKESNTIFERIFQFSLTRIELKKNLHPNKNVKNKSTAMSEISIQYQ